MNSFELLKLLQCDSRFTLSDKVGSYIYESSNVPITRAEFEAEQKLINEDLQKLGLSPLEEFMGTIEADVFYLTIKGELPHTNIMPSAMTYWGNEPVYFFDIFNFRKGKCCQKHATWLCWMANDDPRFTVEDDAWSLFCAFKPGVIPGSDAATELLALELQSDGYPPMHEFTGKVELGEFYLVLRSELPKSDCAVDAICNKDGVMHYFYKLN